MSGDEGFFDGRSLSCVFCVVLPVRRGLDSFFDDVVLAAGTLTTSKIGTKSHATSGRVVHLAGELPCHAPGLNCGCF